MTAVMIPWMTKNPISGGRSRRARRTRNAPYRTLPVRSTSRSRVAPMRKPDSTRKTSTPRKPPSSANRVLPDVEEDDVAREHGRDGVAAHAVESRVDAQQARSLVGRPTHRQARQPLQRRAFDQEVRRRGEDRGADQHHQEGGGERGAEVAQPAPAEPVVGDPLVPQVDAVGAQRHRRRGAHHTTRQVGDRTRGGQRARDHQAGGTDEEQHVPPERLAPVEAREDRGKTELRRHDPQRHRRDRVRADRAPTARRAARAASRATRPD